MKASNHLYKNLSRQFIVEALLDLMNEKSYQDISVTDMHIIEAIGIEEPRTMSTISKSLGVTMGTLTVGINGLVKKGYVIRKRGEKDRRIAYASLTDKGIAAYRHHENFHKDMIENITKDLTKEEAEVLTKTFIRLEDFFHQLP